MVRRALVSLALLAGACNTDFEDPSIVLDLRILGMRADPPEIVAPVDPQDPTDVDAAKAPTRASTSRASSS